MTERTIGTPIKEFMRGRINVLAGDITNLAVDAIVNAANSSLLGGGGVDGAIHRAAGPALLAACRKLRETEYPAGLPAGCAAVTGAGRLAARHVIHTVGPVFQPARSDNASLLASCYQQSLALAESFGCRSIAFPAISTGAYGYPKSAAAAVAWEAVRGHLAQSLAIEKVIFIFFSRGDADIFMQAAGR